MRLALNGWQRLWVVASVLWLAVVCAFTALFLRGEEGGTASLLLGAFLVWAVPSVFLYLLGLSVAWILRGFRRASQ
jgi:hypothetical protein